LEKVSVPRVIGAGVLFAIIGVIVHTLGVFPTMGFYMDPAYFAVWSKLMMPTAGAPPITFYYYSIGFGIITGILLGLVFAIVRGGVSGVGTKRGIVYGLLIFLVAGVPGSLSLYLLVNLPSALIAYWAFEDLVAYLLGGAVFGRLIQ
jgi:hypothetical protein